MSIDEEDFEVVQEDQILKGISSDNFPTIY
jgi:hypothetical protein